jgi:subtilisin family serine protease
MKKLLTLLMFLSLNSLAASVPNELLVKFKTTTTAQEKETALTKLGGKVKTSSIGERTDLITYSTKLKEQEAINLLVGEGIIEYVEPNYTVKLQAVPTDTSYVDGSLWGMQGGFGSRANEAWANGHTDCSAVTVGIVDEGIMFDHSDLTSNRWNNPSDWADRVDTDVNGKIDDVNGWNFFGMNNTIFSPAAARGTTTPSESHGTHVAGTIGGLANGTGVVGVCWGVKIISAKVFDKSGTATIANFAAAINYLVSLKNAGANLVAINASYGGNVYSSTESSAIDNANLAGILIVAAAGNESLDNDTTPHYPSSYSQANIIAVASINSSGALASSSNYGATSVDIAAPGENILSTIPIFSGTTNTVTSGLGYKSGTSMATPHVTGAAALYKAYHPTETAAQIKAAILNSATPTASLTGKCVTGGRLNISGF